MGSIPTEAIKMEKELPLWSNEGINEFIKKVGSVNTGGAVSKYEAKFTWKDDGDEWLEVTLPVWTNNDCVIFEVFNLTIESLKNKNTGISLIQNAIVLRLYTRCWNGAS